MSLSIHWEWRGFGTVSPQFKRRFADALPQRLVDEYLWIPGVDVNLKFRQGTGYQDGLKFKRMAETQGEFERWHESIAEIFPFPLSAHAWHLLLSEMDARHEPPVDTYRDETVNFLRSINPRIQTVVVHKERRSVGWGPNSEVKVELAEIQFPTQITSVGLEAGSIELLETARYELGLQREPLETMNYLHYMRRCVEE